MYVPVVLLLTIIAPVATALVRQFVLNDTAPQIVLLGEAYVFWAGGVRLLLAGLRQVFQPKFTAQQIFEITDEKPLQIVQELGFANLSMGLLCLISPLIPGAPLTGAIVAGAYYGLAGLKHFTTKSTHTANRRLAMWTDVLVFVVLAIYTAFTLAGLFQPR
jgi:hypothetical protein